MEIIVLQGQRLHGIIRKVRTGRKEIKTTFNHFQQVIVGGEYDETMELYRGSAGLMLCVILMAGCRTNAPLMKAVVLWLEHVPEPVYISDTYRQTVSSAEGRGDTLCRHIGRR
ncbi:MAG: hypothetical protein ACLR7G_11305 [[Clostridium] symbiosum]